MILPFLCLLIGLASANYGQDNMGVGRHNGGQQYGNQQPTYNGDQQYGNQRPTYNGNQQYGNQGVNRGSDSGGFGYYNNNNGESQRPTYNNNNNQGLGQGVGQNNYGNEQGYNQDGYAGLGRSGQDYESLGRSNGYRVKRDLGQSQESGVGASQPNVLGQQTGVGGVGQGSQTSSFGEPNGLGQQSGLGQHTGLGQQSGLGQHTGLGQQPGIGGQQSGLGQHTQPGLKQSDKLGGSLRFKRYIEREPYSKTCNSYYGKYICYRLYENSASIPHEFTCWSTYLGKKNCTETENVLYLDRRNVEVDPDEIGRQYYPTANDRSTDRDSSRRDQHRQRDDEFGAVGKNLHNRRQNDRELPRDNDRSRY